MSGLCSTRYVRFLEAFQGTGGIDGSGDTDCAHSRSIGPLSQRREITIEPGGQIARHSHETRPGLVKVIGGTWGGTWTEGRPGGEADYAASAPVGILEDRETVHWFWNRGAEPASAIVCDIVPAS